MDQPFIQMRNAEGVLSELETALKPRPPGRVVIPDVMNLMVQEASLRVSRLGLKVHSKADTEPCAGCREGRETGPATRQEGASRPHGDSVSRVSAGAGGVEPLT